MNRRTFVASAVAAPLAVLATLKASDEPVRFTVPKQPERSLEARFSIIDLLWAISQVETGGDDAKIGPCGSRSRFQISESVWNDTLRRKGYATSAYPFSECNTGVAEGIAISHLHWLNRNVPRGTIAEIYERPRILAWCWRGGLESWTKRRGWVNAEYSHYSDRVWNLYCERTGAKPA